ncbi:hypothetical protein N7532_004552 [Penicillium argentinense]|uniref:Uncharacterized protein n=1 Tax=Penicillium argentinense TaxID=1131581 RepID=A0A9W9KFS2_9EURO|nr:uncharacterized protein N7532_004552 [Penicillium argentinense]KAJ5104023.1 hypothetical protein N7532_004552 [Penicillium argentinense]
MVSRRGTKSKTPGSKRTSANPPSRKQFNPSLHRFQERYEQKEFQAKPHGIPVRVLSFMGVTVLAMSMYSGYLYASYQREVSKAQSLDVPRDVSDRYNSTAPTFDAEVELSEKAMRLGKKRGDLIRLARGDVLEVSCGTGRNLEYYDLGERRGTDDQGHAAVIGCRSLTFVDLSPQMVDITREKFQAANPEFTHVAFRAQDAGAVTVEAPARVRDLAGAGKDASDHRAYYDTIVQTMGLCSMADPVGTLRHLGEITEPERGRILLLEHGRSHYDWLNRILDNLAPLHADKHGCWWNRDIGAIVEESGLEVVEVKRWHFGTTWRYVLRPKILCGEKK